MQPKLPTYLPNKPQSELTEIDEICSFDTASAESCQDRH